MTYTFPTARSADMILLLEGTFPYVRGGVSSWVEQMIRSFPQYTFACVFIGSRRSDYGEPAYELPDNVVHLETHFLYDVQDMPIIANRESDAETFARVADLHDKLRNPLAGQDSGSSFHDHIDLFDEKTGIAEEDFLYSRQSWEYIKEQYRKYCTDPSFTDYFWTVRIMHKPLWQLMKVCQNLPAGRVYHSVSTGYAGFLGALLHYRNGRPLITSEHGIYTKERKIDLFQNNWINDNRRLFEKDISQVSYFRQLWIRFFETVGRICYDASIDVVALFEGNRARQIIDGAPQEKTNIISNGIFIEKFAPLRAERKVEIPPVLSLIGRVVPIKDIKTFIRAMLTISNAVPGVQGWIVGPEDEDPEYALECRDLVDSLGLQKVVIFKGFQHVRDVLPDSGLVVLSSISEALPLVILEAFAAGVPVVTTDVGACSEMVFGRPGEDAELGPAGDIVRIADPTALANAALSLLRDPNRWRAAQQAGINRVERYYTLDVMVDAYEELYKHAMSLPDVQRSANQAKKCPMHNEGSR